MHRTIAAIRRPVAGHVGLHSSGLTRQRSKLSVMAKAGKEQKTGVESITGIVFKPMEEVRCQIIETQRVHASRFGAEFIISLLFCSYLCLGPAGIQTTEPKEAF